MTKASKAYSIDTEIIELIAKEAQESGITEGHALEKLVRNGWIRARQLDKQMSKLAPDPAEMQ